MESVDDLFGVFDSKPSASSLLGKRQGSPSLENDGITSRPRTSTSEPENLPPTPPEIRFSEFQHQEFETLTTEGCLHEVCYPPFWKSKLGESLQESSKTPAKEYKFVLDAFQQRSVNCLEKGESVLVSAHTSAGKTVVAEYAIAMALRDGQRVVYTSPIKALSNQKYRELSEEFGDVGLMTGDVVLNPSASCLVMTTEILRNMLYRGSEIMREVQWVIYDEIHYMSDKNRGVVWEESMILLPHKVRYVFLSATIPNAREFCLWIAKLHNQPVNVVYTDKRPTPLQHYVFPVGGTGLHIIVDQAGTFKDLNFARALSDLNSSKEPKQMYIKSNSKFDARRQKSAKKAGEILKVVKMLFAKKFDPVICFAFSKRDCETNAMEISKLDLTNSEEKKQISEIFRNAIDGLSDEDKKLPQVVDILPLLQQGIGIHHSGLLPILKEVTEILFQEGYLKVLFSTETFAMGLNMPARTCVFTSITKFDGTDQRLISPGEYIQMSGRAGRRGLDDKGIVIMIMDEKLDAPVCKQVNRFSILLFCL